MITLDLSKPSLIVDSGIEIIENDSGILLEFKIVNNGQEADISGKTAKIRFRSQTGFVTDNPLNVTDSSSLSYKLLGTEFTIGHVLAIISLYDENSERVSTCRFSLECIDGLNSDTSVKATQYYSELEEIKKSNTITNTELVENELYITFADGNTYCAGSVDIPNEETRVIETSVLSGLETNKIYKLTTENAQIVGLPSVDATCQNQILVYLQTTGQISIIWGDDIAFVDDVIPTIGIGCYRIIFEYNSVLGKWVVGVIQDGAVV